MFFIRVNYVAVSVDSEENGDDFLTQISTKLSQVHVGNME